MFLTLKMAYLRVYVTYWRQYEKWGVSCAIFSKLTHLLRVYETSDGRTHGRGLHMKWFILYAVYCTDRNTFRPLSTVRRSLPRFVRNVQLPSGIQWRSPEAVKTCGKYERKFMCALMETLPWSQFSWYSRSLDEFYERLIPNLKIIRPNV